MTLQIFNNILWSIGLIGCFWSFKFLYVPGSFCLFILLSIPGWRVLQPVRFLFWKLFAKMYYYDKLTGGNPLLCYPMLIWMAFTGRHIYIRQGDKAFRGAGIATLEEIASALTETDPVKITERGHRAFQQWAEQSEMRDREETEREIARLDKLPVT